MFHIIHNEHVWNFISIMYIFFCPERNFVLKCRIGYWDLGRNSDADPSHFYFVAFHSILKEKKTLVYVFHSVDINIMRSNNNNAHV